MSEPINRDRTDVGTVMSIRGSVVDARFLQRLPAINHQLAAGPGGIASCKRCRCASRS